MDNMIDIDVTIVVQLVNFLIALVALNYFLIKPVREQIAARKELTAGYAGDIETFTTEANEKLAGYESALAEARSQAASSRDAIKAEGLSRQHDVLEQAQNQAQTFLLSSREQTAKDAKAATKALLSQVNVFADKAMKKILG